MSELSEKDFDRVERFLLGEMSETESREFRKEINENPKLRKMVEEHGDLMAAIKAEGLKHDLEDIHHELYDAKPKSNKFLIWSLAASFAVIIGMAFWYFNQDANDLSSQYAYTDPGLPVPMSATESYAFHDAMVDYKTEDYDKAISKWEKLLEENPANDTLQYFIGAANFNNENWNEAESRLRDIADSPSTFRHKAQYMLLLIELKKGNREAILNYEIPEDSPFKDQIKSLQDAL